MWLQEQGCTVERLSCLVDGADERLKHMRDFGCHLQSHIDTRISRAHGLHPSRTGTRTVDSVLRADDLVVAVCDNAHEELDPHRARLHWAILDPVLPDTDQASDTAYDDITRRVEQLADTVAAHQT